jgi:thiosulfate reductase cytochrome b subunit
MERDPQVHPRHVRVAHWINAVVLLVMLWSGFAMLIADRHFAGYVHLIPPAVWNALQLTGHRVQGRAWHLGMAIAFAANAIFYAWTSLASGTWRRLVPRGRWLHDAWTATLEELTAPRASLQRSDYNGAQRLTYSLVLAGGAVMVMTGVALWFGRRFPWMTAAFGGERIALTIHVVLAVALLAFIVVHVLQVLRAGLPTLLAMITGGTEPRPARTRNGLAWTASVMASLVAAFAIANQTSGPTGVPAFLRWAVPSHGVRQSPRAIVHRGPERTSRSD